jgi:hypothetical protein
MGFFFTNLLEVAMRAADWPLYTEMATTYNKPLGRHQAQDMWAGG